MCTLKSLFWAHSYNIFGNISKLDSLFLSHDCYYLFNQVMRKVRVSMYEYQLESMFVHHMRRIIVQLYMDLLLLDCAALKFWIGAISEDAPLCCIRDFLDSSIIHLVFLFSYKFSFEKKKMLHSYAFYVATEVYNFFIFWFLFFLLSCYFPFTVYCILCLGIPLFFNLPRMPLSNPIMKHLWIFIDIKTFSFSNYASVNSF